MFLSSGFGGCRVIAGPIPQHGEQDVAAAPGECHQGLVVTLALAHFALVVGPGDRVTQGGEGREEPCALERLVAPSGGVLSADRGSGVAGDWCEARVCSEVCGGVEVAAHDLGQESCGDPEA